MRKAAFLVFVTFIALSAFNAEHARATSDRWDCLLQKNNEDHEGVREACSRIVRDPFESLEMRSDALSMRAYHFAVEELWERALREYDSALVFNPENAYAFAGRGDVYLLTREYDRAINDYTSAIALRPLHEPPYEGRAIAYEKKGDGEQALKNWDILIELNRQSRHYSDGRARALALLDRQAETREERARGSAILPEPVNNQ